MKITIDRVIQAIERNQNIGIIADYDVDGSTSAAILIKFFEFYQKKLNLKIPDRLNEGYGPNTRIMNYFLKEKINLRIQVTFFLDMEVFLIDLIVLFLQ